MSRRFRDIGCAWAGDASIPPSTCGMTHVRGVHICVVVGAARARRCLPAGRIAVKYTRSFGNGKHFPVAWHRWHGTCKFQTEKFGYGGSRSTLSWPGRWTAIITIAGGTALASSRPIVSCAIFQGRGFELLVGGTVMPLYAHTDMDLDYRGKTAPWGVRLATEVSEQDDELTVRALGTDELAYTMERLTVSLCATLVYWKAVPVVSYPEFQPGGDQRHQQHVPPQTHHRL